MSDAKILSDFVKQQLGCGLCAEKDAEIAALKNCNNPLDPCRECIHCLKTDWVWKHRDELRAENAALKAENERLKGIAKHDYDNAHSTAMQVWELGKENEALKAENERLKALENKMGSGWALVGSANWPRRSNP